MKKTLFLSFTIFFLKTSFSQNNYKIENGQQRLATFIVNEIEKNRIDSIYQFFDPIYFNKQKRKLKSLLENFYSDYVKLASGTKRYTALVWPTGFNLFRFRYIDSTGTVLQIDLSFKKDDINSKVLLLETVDRHTFKKQRKESSTHPQVKFKD